MLQPYSPFSNNLILPDSMPFKSARLLTIVLLTLAVALSGLVFIRNLIDFPVYYSAGQSLLKGRSDLYAADFALGRVMDYRYPPFFLLVFTPLWLLPYKVAAFLWYLFSVFQIATSVVLLRRLLKPVVISKKCWLQVFCGVGQYFIIILHYGNAHLLAIFLLFVSLYFALHRQDGKAALLMALAITIKLTPAFLLLYFLLMKRWRYLLLVGAFLLAINLTPAAYFGFSQNARLVKSWYHHVVANQEFHELNGPINLSLKGQLRRYFTEVDYQQRVDGDTRYPAVNLFSSSPQLMARIWLIVSFGGVLFAAFLIFRQSHKPQPDRTADQLQTAGSRFNGFDEKTLVTLGMLISLMLFVEPLTSKIYFIALLWPFTVLAVATLDRPGRANRHIRWVLLVIAILNFGLPLLPGRLIQRGLLVLGADFYVNLLLMAAQFYYLLALPPPRPPDGEPQRPAR